MSGRRLRVLEAVAFVVLAVLGAQLLRVQVLDPPAYAVGADGTRLRSLPIEAPRGLVLDRDGVVLASNVPQFAIEVVPGDLPADEEARREVLLAIEREAGVPYADIEHALASELARVDPFAAVTVLPGLDRQSAIALSAALASQPGVHVRAQPIRVYEGGELLARILGYVGPLDAAEVDRYLDAGYELDARVGRSGVEGAYEDELRGAAGQRVVVASAAGRELELLGENPPRPGADLVLSIDLDLQRAAFEAVNDGLDKGLAYERSHGPDPEGGRERSGAAVVLDVHTGEVLAMVSVPSYEANVFSGEPDGEAVGELLGDESRPLIDRAFQSANAPGSIFKPFVGAAALEEGIATPSTTITSTGAITVTSIYDPSVTYTFRDWAAHGTLDFYGGIARSSDVYFYYLAGGYAQGGTQIFEGLGADRVAAYVRAFGLGTPTGLDLPGEAEGLVPDTEWKEKTVGDPWVLGDTYTFGIGQGYLAVTPMQMAVAAAALANGGEVLTPHVVRGFDDGSGLRLLDRKMASRVPVSDANLEVVREAMRIAANPGGTALTGEPAGVEIAGKTGTAEFGPQHPDGQYDSHGWYMGFAPYDDPEVAIIVYLEHGVGATHAGPVAKSILEAYFALQQQDAEGGEAEGTPVASRLGGGGETAE